ncbi:diacylglycerol kinase epsilon [Arctopsyche grandis]|uniref:diacylglycerol kinase epsilon n=1 Tax=Arctopsyche grandis TaxID=121162 RepID=UPI00406D72BE
MCYHFAENFIYPVFRLFVYFLLPSISAIYIFNWWYSDIYVTKKYRSKGHSWRSIQSPKSIPYNTLCSVCGRLMMSAVGEFCERCALSACRGCKKLSEKNNPCRVLSISPNEPFLHHWVKVGAVCEDCNLSTDTDVGYDFFCCWCQQIKHFSTGEPSKDEVCNFGNSRSMIIPPSQVKISRTGQISVTPPDWDDWQPIILVGNPISGGGTGDEVLSLFRGLLNPIQVVRLSKKGLQSALNWIPSSARIIVAGGDGTVSAVVSTITNMNIADRPPVGILPLGTGNDLSRVLGWGGSCPAPLSPFKFLNDIRNATVQPIDRWSVTVGRRKLFAYNYLSIGVDARVALDFHRARLHPLYLRGSQSINYLIYLCLGTQQVLSQDCHGLEKLLELHMNNNVIALPPLQALLLLNIPSWGAGVDVWNAGADQSVAKQSMNDGKLEVLGINSSFHIAKLQIGLSQPIRLGQASSITIKIKNRVPMQVDGEPWEQNPCEIQVEQMGTALVLSKTSD